MKHYTVDYATTGILSNIVKDYIEGKESQQQFYKYAFQRDQFQQIIQDKAKANTDRDLLVDTVLKQYEGFIISDAVKQNLELLRKPTTFTITTAHQPNVFTGYLYFAHKILGTIKTTELLKADHPEYDFVPVYWIGSEDHDFDEINHINLFGETITWPGTPGGALGRMDPSALAECIDVIEEKLGTMPYAAELVDIFKKAYLGHKTLADATIYMVNELFGRFGLVIVDQDKGAYKTAFADVIKDELKEQRVSSLINDTIEALNQQDYKIQASPREINLFYLWDNKRERIVKEGDTYKVLNTDISFTEAEMMAEVDAKPDRFSPNVFLRPVFQETILPNLAYVGGAGELAYWLELKSIFEHYGVNYPMLMLRNVAGVMDAQACKKMKKVGLTMENLFENEEEVIKRYVRDNTDQQLDLTKEKAQIEELFAGIVKKAASVDPTLERTVEGQKQGQLNALAGLEAKILRAEKRNFEVAVNQIRAVMGRLFPNGKLMERVDNFIPFYAKYGAAFFDQEKEAFDPFNKQFTLFFEE